MQGYFAGKLMLTCTQTQSMFTHKEEEICNLELKLPWDAEMHFGSLQTTDLWKFLSDASPTCISAEAASYCLTLGLKVHVLRKLIYL